MALRLSKADATKLLREKLTPDDLRALLASVKGRHKYGAERITVEGKHFDSRGEAGRHAELRLLEMAGVIRELNCQAAFPLHVLQVETGELIRIGEYRADFVYVVQATGVRVIEDFKQEFTAKNQLYRLKKKHVEAQYGVVITERFRA